MKKHVLYILLIFLTNCNKSDSFIEEISELKVDSYHIGYMEYSDFGKPTFLIPQNGSTDTLVRLEYDKFDRITKRQGGLVPAPSVSGVDHFFSDQIYDNVTYSNDEILIERVNNYYSTSKFISNINMTNGKLVSKIVDNYNDKYKDTIRFSYNNEGLISKRIKYIQCYSPDHDQHLGLTITSDFHYNSNKNLDSINTIYFNVWDGVNEKIIKEIYSDYDNAINPLKNLIIFDETFNRSLSNNNYARYEKHDLTIKRDIPVFYKRWWDFYYDDNGNISFDY